MSRSITTQDELFAVEQYHAVFTDSPFELIQAEEQQRARPTLVRPPYPPPSQGWHREHGWINLFTAACGPACSCGQTNPRTGHRTLRLHGPQPSHPISNPDKPQE